MRARLGFAFASAACGLFALLAGSPSRAQQGTTPDGTSRVIRGGAQWGRRTPKLSAQPQTSTPSSSGVPPLVYAQEDTGTARPTLPPVSLLPVLKTLPDPFLFLDGRRRTVLRAWQQRRREIETEIQQYEIGPKPDCHDCRIIARYSPPALPGERGILSVTVKRRGRTMTLTAGIWLPSGLSPDAHGPYPAVIAMTFRRVASGPNYGALSPESFAGLPVATVDFNHDQVARYTRGSADHSADPFYQLYPELCAGKCTGTSNSGEYAAWSWGVSRLIDGLALVTRRNDDLIDMRHLAVTGCSYAGKMALFAGAFDERIALTIAQENGGGGAASWRASQELEPDGTVEKIGNTNYDWFGAQMRHFSGENVVRLPEDHHELMALVAPRALLETGNTDYTWLSNRSNYVAARATEHVYDQFGISDRFGFVIDGGHPHCKVPPAQVPVVNAFVRKFLLGDTAADTAVRTAPYPTLDTGRWTADWGEHRASRGDSPR